MKIASQFAGDRQLRRFAQHGAALQSDFQLAAFGFRDRDQHAPWSKRNDLRGLVADKHGTLARIARVEAGTVDHHLAAGNRVNGIDPQYSGRTRHKSRSSYDATGSMSNCSLWYNSRPE